MLSYNILGSFQALGTRITQQVILNLYKPEYFDAAGYLSLIRALDVTVS